MKRSFAILLTAIIALSCFLEMETVAFAEEHALGSDDPPSRPESEKVLLAVNEYGGGADGALNSVRFEYDEKGRLISDGRYDYVYDDAGRLLHKSLKNWEDYRGDEALDRSYDSSDRLISESFLGPLDMWMTWEYTYGEDGRATQMVRSVGIMGGETSEAVYTVSYQENAQGELAAYRHYEGQSAVDAEFVYDREGRMIQDYDEYWLTPIYYEYIDDPYFCVRDELGMIDGGGPDQYDLRMVYILDSAGKEIKSFILGTPEYVQMTYDDEGYLISAEASSQSRFQWSKIEFIYGEPGAEPEAPSPTPKEETLPPLAYENQTEHHERVTSAGVLVGTSDLAFPYFTDGSQMADLLNESIGTVLDQRRDAEMDPQYEEYFSEMVAKGMPPSTDDVEITVTYNADGLLSLLYRYTFYNTGAAHPYTGYEGCIYETDTLEQLDYHDLAGRKLPEMSNYFDQRAKDIGLTSQPSEAESCVLSSDGVSFYCWQGDAAPRAIVNVPFTKQYFDRAPDNSAIGDDDESAGYEPTVSESESSNQAATTTLTVTGDGVNIRSGPGTSYGSIGSVNSGDKLFSKGKSDDWYMVEYGGSTGYIVEDYVTIEHGGFYTAVDSGTLSVNGTDVNIRSGPGKEYQSIGSVSGGTTLTITGKSDNWYQVDYNGRKGYIIEDYVTKKRVRNGG